MQRKNKKVRQGTVISNKMRKTAVLLVEQTIKHPIYKRTIKFSKKFQFHDEENSCNIGDKVQIIECKPISKHKHWRLLEIIKS